MDSNKAILKKIQQFPWAILASIALHALIIGLILQSNTQSIQANHKTALTVMLMRQPIASTSQDKASQPSQTPQKTHSGTKQLAIPEDKPVVRQSAAQSMAEPVYAPQLDADALREQARIDLEKASRQQRFDPMRQPAPFEKQPLSPFERQGKQRERNVEQLSDGSLRVTHPNGTHYCLKPLPAMLTNDLPIPVLSAPMHCP